MRRVLLTLMLLVPLAARAQPATVFAAASLTDALKAVAALYAKTGHPAPVLSFGASSTLARQIDQGAPANLFFSADERWMDWLAHHGHVAAGTRVDLLRNHLVLIVPKRRARSVTLGPNLDINAVLGANGRLATGDPAHVPVGLYAKQALTKLGLWSKLSNRMAPTPDVRAALLLVQRGEAPAGIVYSTDAAASHGVAVAATFPESSHDPITYPVAIVKDADTKEAQSLLAFLKGKQARAIFTRFGFGTE